jgi:HrpA-like RNA helicase
MYKRDQFHVVSIDHLRRRTWVCWCFSTVVSSEEGHDEVELYLSAFPTSQLVLAQIESSIQNYVDVMGPMLSLGSIRVIKCNDREEADVHVARASEFDETGNTYVLGDDSDYLIYGCGRRDQEGGEAKYIRFCQIDPSCSSMKVRGKVLTRSNAASIIGLPFPGAMIELSILLGNDYTGPFLNREENFARRRGYWESLRWYYHGEDDGYDDAYNDDYDKNGGSHEELPHDDQPGQRDVRGIADHVAERCAEGWRLTSDDPDLRAAIRYSYILYSFNNVRKLVLPSTVSNSQDELLISDRVFPSLPRGLNLSLSRRGVSAVKEKDLAKAALIPLNTYMTENADFNELEYVESRHISAFFKTINLCRLGRFDKTIDQPQQKLHWNDMRALYVLERCLLAAIENTEIIPNKVFSHSVFHSYLEKIFMDCRIEDQIVSAVENLQIEGAADVSPDGDKGSSNNISLPIDDHKDDILHTVKTQRVTIIHGETGCGKSSRVPCFLLRADPPEPTQMAPEVKMIVSQPRRIAAKALAERVRSCEPDIADKIGLRMGHGLREHETSKTRAWFVTTGYVVRLLANHPGWFNSHTHLIIDEVHERSIDTDILCLLCRRLLNTHPTIRLVLMSATMAAELYSQYFGSPQPPIHVGARRFQIEEYFVEDLSKKLMLSSKNTKLALNVYEECEKSKCKVAPTASTMEKLHTLAAQITASVGGNGSSVLIFVPGMSDIESIIELIEKFDIPGSTFICLPIHSDVPFEEQMAAFEPAKVGEVKVIIATNAAESSLTLPDVDHVVCLGLCKQIVYNAATHRQMLCPTWISRASATQRAGRTGRVRPGTVYRLYSRNAFCHYMPMFEQGELARSPLDNTILSLRDMLNEAVTPILLDCLEPPDISTIERSFQSLHESNFISSPTDEGVITSLGSLVVALGIDLTLGALVGLGIQFGVAAESIQLAAILSFPKTPWAVSSPMYHDTHTFNEIVTKTFTSRCFFDAGLFSEPMGIANLLHDFSTCKDRKEFCWKHRVVASRMGHLYGTVESLKRRVAERLGVSPQALDMETPPYLMSTAKLNILRILQCWMFHDTMIVQSTSKNSIKAVGGAIPIKLEGPPISQKHLAQILDEKQHPFELLSEGKSSTLGHFQTEYGDDDDRALRPQLFSSSFEIRLVSLMLENNIDLSFYIIEDRLQIFVPTDVWEKPGSKLRDWIIGSISVKINEVCYVHNSIDGNQRGRRGRACGLWHPSTKGELKASNGSLPSRFVTCLSALAIGKKDIKGFKKTMENNISTIIKSSLKVNIIEEKTRLSFSVTTSGQCRQISQTDLGDLFAAPDLVSHTESNLRQIVQFRCVDSDRNELPRPLIKDAPEGARLMSVLASERRKSSFIRFSDGGDDQFIDVNLPRNFAINGNRWKRKQGGMVYVPENCVPTAIIPVDDVELYACCANTLELRGGACKAEGITLLPKGRLFVGLALLAFGINPKTGVNIDVSEIHEYIEAEEKKDSGLDLKFFSENVVEDVWRWIKEKEKFSLNQPDRWRVMEALQFHANCMSLGETLQCQPDKISALCALFDGVDGAAMTVWDLEETIASLRPKQDFKMNRTHITPSHQSPSTPIIDNNAVRDTVATSDAKKSKKIQRVRDKERKKQDEKYQRKLASTNSTDFNAAKNIQNLSNPNSRRSREQARDGSNGCQGADEEQQKANENYAWCAFQSSPDPSALPDIGGLFGSGMEDATAGQLSTNVRGSTTLVNLPIKKNEKLPIKKNGRSRNRKRAGARARAGGGDRRGAQDPKVAELIDAAGMKWD